MVDSHPVSIDLLEIPDGNSFKGFVKESDLEGLETRDKKTIIAMSVLEQWSEFHTEAIVEINRHMRALEADSVRRITEVIRIKEEQKRQGWGLSAAKWFAVTLGAGVISTFLRWMIEKP